jgi:hypothetical protein
MPATSMRMVAGNFIACPSIRKIISREAIGAMDASSLRMEKRGVAIVGLNHRPVPRCATLKPL